MLLSHQIHQGFFFFNFNSPEPEVSWWRYDKWNFFDRDSAGIESEFTSFRKRYFLQKKVDIHHQFLQEG